MIGFLDVTRFDVPRPLVDEANRHLHTVGKKGLEGFALWAGRLDDTVFRVETTIIPKQDGVRLESGLCVTVGPQELHRINVWLYQNGMRLGVQIHSHPTKPYHSDTDNTYPIATTLGSLSIVVPDFAPQDFDLRATATYRLHETGWLKIPSDQLVQLVKII